MDYHAIRSTSNFIKLTLIFLLFQTLPTTCSENNETQNDCKMLETNRLKLDLACVLRLNGVAHQLLAPTKEDCQNACCNWTEGSCDLVYWGNSRTCVIMNYYVLGSCPLLASSNFATTHSSYSLLLSITTKTSTPLKKHLLKEYRNEIGELLGCTKSDFVCDNWQCIPYKHLCDGVDHCSDNSDETSCPRIVVTNPHSKCLDYTGKYVSTGSEYTPMNETDECQTCICGANGLPSYCYSATCDRKILSDCNVPYPDMCCRCQKGRGIIEGDHIDTEEAVSLSSTQRLIVSCMSVLVLITLLLFFSRNLVNRGRNGLFQRRPPGRSHMPREVALGLHCRYPPSQSFMERYFPRSDSVSFFDDHDYSEAPPAYNMLKINGETLGPPPSYPSSVEINEDRDLEVDTSLVTDNPTTSQEPVNTSLSDQQPNRNTSLTVQQPVENTNLQDQQIVENTSLQDQQIVENTSLPEEPLSENQPHTSVTISSEPVYNDEPISPLSTTSQSPLINDNEDNVV